MTANFDAVSEPATVNVERVIRMAAFASLLLAAVLWVGPAILRVDLFDGDATQHIFWLYRYVDPTLFPNDISVEYLRTSAPIGYRALYALVAPHADALRAAEILAAVLFVVTGFIAWKIGTAIEGPGRALRGLFAVMALIALATLAPSDLLPTTAFQRTFALPITLLCLWALIAHRYLWVGGSWILAACFYPVLLPVLGLAGGFVFLRDIIVERRMPPLWWANGMAGVVALALALFCIPKVDWLLPAYTYSQAIAMPEFGYNGRLQLFVHGFFANNFRYHMVGLGWSVQFVLIILAAVAAAWWFDHRRYLPVAAWIFLGVGLAIWTAMRLFPEKLMFGLYLPNRHTRWSIAAFAVVAISAGAYAVFVRIVDWIRRQRGEAAATSATYALAFAAPILTLLAVLPHALAQLKQPVDRDFENIYAFIASLPKDTLIGAQPDLASDVPLRTQHSVLTSTEVAMPWFAGYNAKIAPRLESLFRAAYATDIAQVDKEMAPWGVKVFVTGPPVWRATGYFDPYDRLVKELIERGRREGFALKNPPADRVLYRSGDYYVLQLHQP
jgi:hypothetical protein